MTQGPVLTAVTMAVGETLKGEAGASVTFRVHGGVIGRYESRVIGAPVFAVDDDAYVFLSRARDGAWWPVGMSAGVYKVQRGAVAPPVVAGVTTATSGPVARGDVRRRVLTPSEFAGVVRPPVARTKMVSPSTGVLPIADQTAARSSPATPRPATIAPVGRGARPAAVRNAASMRS